jgi:sulfite exporter TauE/SafE
LSALSSDLIPLAVLGASLLGSGHCVGMCGGLVLAVGRGPAKVGAYHFGRLLGYLSLGALAGALGAATLRSERVSWISWPASLLLAAAFIQMGVNLWRGRGNHLFALPQSWVRKLHEVSRGNAFAVGTLSALLPCGWLHGFVLASLATQSVSKGALVLFFFWLGTVPALSAAPWLVSRVLGPLARRTPRLAAAFLIAAGLASLGVRAAPLMGWNLQTHGHDEASHSAHEQMICH